MQDKSSLAAALGQVLLCCNFRFTVTLAAEQQVLLASRMRQVWGSHKFREWCAVSLLDVLYRKAGWCWSGYELGLLHWQDPSPRDRHQCTVCFVVYVEQT